MILASPFGLGTRDLPFSLEEHPTVTLMFEPAWCDRVRASLDPENGPNSGKIPRTLLCCTLDLARPTNGEMLIYCIPRPIQVSFFVARDGLLVISCLFGGGLSGRRVSAVRGTMANPAFRAQTGREGSSSVERHRSRQIWCTV